MMNIHSFLSAVISNQILELGVYVNRERGLRRRRKLLLAMTCLFIFLSLRVKRSNLLKLKGLPRPLGSQ